MLSYGCFEENSTASSATDKGAVMQVTKHKKYDGKVKVSSASNFLKATEHKDEIIPRSIVVLTAQRMSEI